MTTISNNKLPEWRKALNSAVENYQSTRAWYEENRDSPAALDDMERAEDQLANFVRKCGFSIVLSLLDEIDELQERRKADSEPAGYHVIKECGKVGCSVATLEQAEKTRDFWNKRWTIRPYFYTQPALVATGATNSPVTPDGWISCSERMPAQDDWVLIYSKHGEYLAGQVQGEYVELNDGTLSWLGSALHWMLLPEPPQQEVK